MNMSIVVVKIWALFFLIAVPIFPGDINLDLEPKEQIEKFIFKKIFPNTQSWSKIREKIIATSKDVPYKILQYAAKIDFFEKKNTKGKIVQLRKLKGLNIETLQIAQEGGLFKVNNTQGDLRSQDIGSDAKEKILKSLQGMDLESLRLVIEAGVLRDLSLERRLLVLKHIQTASPAFIKDDVLPEFEKDKANFKTLMNLLRLNQNENPAQSCDVKILNRPSAEEGISDQSFSKKSGRSLSYSSSYNSAQKYLQRRRDLEKNKRTCEQFLFEKIFPNTEKDSKTREKILLVSQEVPYEILEYSTNIGFFQGLNTREKISQLGALKDVNPDTLDIAQEYHLFELENPKDHPYILLNLGFVYPETLKTIFENFKFEKIDGPGRKKILESLQGMDPESLRLMMNAGV